MAGLAHLADLIDLLLDVLAQPFQLNEQDGRSIHGKAGVGSLFHHPEHHAIQHFDGDRDDGARGNLGYRGPATLDIIVDGQDSLDHLRLAHEAHDHFSDQRQGAFRAGQQAGQVVARQFCFLTSGCHNGAIRHHELQTQDVVGSHAVGQRVRTAGVLGHIAAHGAGALAGGIGSVEITVRLDRQGDIQVDHARFDHRAFVFQVDL